MQFNKMQPLSKSGIVCVIVVIFSVVFQNAVGIPQNVTGNGMTFFVI